MMTSHFIESTEERLNALRMQHHGSQRPLFLEDGTIDPTLVRNEARTMASVLSNMPPTIVTNEIVMEGEADTLLDECLRFQPFVSKTLPDPRETGPQEFKDIIMEHGLPKIKSCGKKFKNLKKADKNYYSKAFKVFARCARVKVNRLLKIGGIYKRRDISCGCLDLDIFQMMFESMDAKFFHSDRFIHRHGIRYKVPCVGYRFKDHLPVLDIFENWGRQEVTSTAHTDDDDGTIITKYLMSVTAISFIIDTESFEVLMHFQYSTQIMFDDETEFHYM